MYVFSVFELFYINLELLLLHSLLTFQHKLVNQSNNAIASS